MASISKYQSSVIGIIKHNIREFENGICPSNDEVDSLKTKDNYSLISRGATAREIEQYRKAVMEEVFHYNRKNIVLANEVVITLPQDCPKDQERQFFEESLRYIESTLPMGEKCILQAEIHKDEGLTEKDGQAVGSAHLHVLYVPAVGIDERTKSKNPGYDYKLSSDQLTKRAILKQWHPNFQKWIDEAGIQATVHSGTTNGKNISVKALKELTKETGMTLDKIKSLDKENQHLKEQLQVAHNKIKDLEKESTHQHTWGTQGWGTIDKTEGEKLW